MGMGQGRRYDRQGYGYGMGPGMMMGHGGAGMGYWDCKTEACQKFLKDTAPLRRKIHNKRFDYMEAARNPETTMGDLQKLQKEIEALQKELYEEAPEELR